ncbi:Protein CBG26202 [Caenorhabditis briggsae]|uniref:Protein CBG26202 n=1 Tax=Caenorhabditis briggsae TaxID=6238 RepID=B6ILU7_CAEBR|nr:Protein CBG26202 [Caenorhabditis briggsae]CAS00877.1 Protein CBG26202 [Caenorhabditis briggsae]
MCYYFLSFMFLSFLTEISKGEPYMIRISGQPGKFKSSKTFDIPWKECIVKCRTDVKCVVVYKMSGIKCQYFEFKSISTVQQAAFGGVEIALKIQLAGKKCPPSNPMVPGPNSFTEKINNQLHATTVSLDSKSKHIYNLNYKVISCPNLMKLFQRGETTLVCIGLFFFEAPRCNNHAQASALCKAQKGTLTGPANADEYKYIQNTSNSSKYTSNPDSYTWLTYWIDGVSTSTEKVYKFEDPTHNGITNYKWTPGSPHLKGPGHCLHNPGPLNSNVQAISCSDAVCTPCSVCWRGALCQVPPIIEMF